MAPTILTPGSDRTANRGWAIAAAVLWAVAVALAVFYFWDGDGAVSATGLETTGTASAAMGSIGGRPAASLSPVSITTTTTEAPTTTTTTLPPALVVAASGDVLGDKSRGPGIFMEKNGGAPLFAEVKPFLEPAQLAFVNLEGPISNKGARATWKEYTFRSSLALAEGLASAGVDVVSLANNHAMDYGATALLDTLVRLDDAGVRYAGAGADAAKAAAPTLLITPAGMVAVLAFTDIVPGGFAAGSKTPGVNATTPDREKILSAVAKATKKADFVIVSFHWGTEYDGQASEAQQTLAHQVVDAGADLVLGHHPHVLQGLELYKNRLIAYSLGDFVWDHYRPVTGETVIIRVSIPPKGPPSLDVIPIYLDEVTGVPAPVTGDRAASILGRLAGYSADLGFTLTISGDRASFAPQAPSED